MSGAPLTYLSPPAVTVSFPLEDDPDVSMIAWTTTPWTLPSNLALCVNPELDYVQIQGRLTWGVGDGLMAVGQAGGVTSGAAEMTRGSGGWDGSGE